MPKVTDFDMALVVNKNVSRFEISVHHVGRVDELQAAKQVVHDDFDMLVTK